MSYTITSHDTNNEIQYLLNLCPVEFTDSLVEAIIFEDNASARTAIEERFISLCNYISSNDIKGIMIAKLKGNKIVREEVFL